MKERFLAVASFLLLICCLIAGTCPSLVVTSNCVFNQQPTCWNNCVKITCTQPEVKIRICSAPFNKLKPCRSGIHYWGCESRQYQQLGEWRHIILGFGEKCDHETREDRKYENGKCYQFVCLGCDLDEIKKTKLYRGECFSDFQSEFDDLDECGDHDENGY